MNTSKDITDFLDKNITSIISSSIVDVQINIKPDNDVKMVLQCPEMYMHRVRPYIIKGALTINTEGSFTLKDPIVVQIYLKTLDEITLSGSGDLKGYFNGNKLKIKSSGTSEVELSGEVNELDVVISGTGNAKLRNLEVKKLNLNLSGISNAQVNVEKYCSVKISGVGNATVFGDPEVLKESVSGLGKVKKGGKIKSVVSEKEYTHTQAKEKNNSYSNPYHHYDTKTKKYNDSIKQSQGVEENRLDILIQQLKDIESKHEMENTNKIQKELDKKMAELAKYNEPKHTEPTPAEVRVSKAQALSKKIKSML